MRRTTDEPCTPSSRPAPAPLPERNRNAARQQSRHRLAHPQAEPRIQRSDHLGRRRRPDQPGRRQRRRRAERPPLAALDLQPGQLEPLHRHHRPQPARSSRPRRRSAPWCWSTAAATSRRSPGDFIVDVNTIPTDLIERVDIVTGGNSAIYGSDAIAGVVNFILRRDFDGIRIRGQGGISQQGDRGIEFVSLTAGRNFFDDRANIAINLEYVNAEPLYFIDRPQLTGAFDGRCQFNARRVHRRRAGRPATAFPTDRSSAASATPPSPTAARSAPASRRGDLPEPRRSSTSRRQCRARRPRCLNPGTPLGQPRIFRFDRPAACSRTSRRSISVRSARATSSAARTAWCRRDAARHRPDRAGPRPLLRQPPRPLRHLGRLPAVLRGQVRPPRRPAGRASRASSRRASRPSSATAAAFAATIRSSRAQTWPRCRRSAAAPAAGLTGTSPLAGSTSISAAVASWSSATPGASSRGIQGDFNDDWNYEIAFNYGHVDIHQDELNDLRIFDIDPTAILATAFLLAIDAVRNGAGQIVCRVNTDADPATTGRTAFRSTCSAPAGRAQAALDFVNTTSFVDSRGERV